MDPIGAYQRAVDRLRDVQDRWAALDPDPGPPDEGDEGPDHVRRLRRELADAHKQLAAASEPLTAQIQTVWDTNRRAVVDTKQAVADAIDQVRRTEETIIAACRRGNRQPTVDERARIDDAIARVDAAREDRAAARARFKAGVTGEQLEDA